MSSATDAEILALADHEDRVLISADSDFGEILTLGPKRKPSLVLFRGEFDPAAEQQAGRLTSLLPELVVLLESGVIVVISRTKVRIRET